MTSHSTAFLVAKNADDDAVTLLPSGDDTSGGRWGEFGIAATSIPFTTITGPNLFVAATTNYASDTIDDVTAIDFDAPGAATATFSAAQFGNSAIAANATITGGGHADTIEVRVADGAVFNGSQLQFANWGASDKFEIAATGDHATVTGESVKNIISMGAFFDSTDKIDGGTGSATLDLSGDYSTEIGVTSSMLQNVNEIVLAAGNSYSLGFSTGVVAAGHAMTIDAANVGASDTLNLYLESDTAGRYVIDLGASNDNRITINDQADTVHCAAGQNFIYSNGVISAQDRIEGNGSDTYLYLDGDYSAGYAFGASEITGVSAIYLEGNFNYKLTTNDANVAAHTDLTVDGSALGSGNSFIFNGSHETNGSFEFSASDGLNELTGGAQSDVFIFSPSDVMTSADRINGGGGSSNTLELDGDYSSGLKFTNATITNIQEIDVDAGHSYNLTLAAGNVSSGETVQVNGGNLSATDSLVFDASKVTTGTLEIYGGAGNDTLKGGGGANQFVGGGGADVMTCGSGTNNFQYYAVSDSTSTAHDTIIGFNALVDTFSTYAETGTPAAIDAAVTRGALSSAHFDTDLTHAIGASQLHANDAVLFTPTTGNLAGYSFLVIDENGTAGYQAGADLVIELTNATNLSHFGLSNFTS